MYDINQKDMLIIYVALEGDNSYQHRAEFWKKIKENYPKAYEHIKKDNAHEFKHLDFD